MTLPSHTHTMKYSFKFLCSYCVFGQLDITGSSFLHDIQRSAQIPTTPEERHPFEDGMYALRHLHLSWMGEEEEKKNETSSLMTEHWMRATLWGQKLKYTPSRALPSSWALRPAVLSCVIPQMSSDAPSARSSDTWTQTAFYLLVLLQHSHTNQFQESIFPKWMYNIFSLPSIRMLMTSVHKNILGWFVFTAPPTLQLWLLFHSQWVVVCLRGKCPERTERGSVWREGLRPPEASPLQPQSTHLYK